MGNIAKLKEGAVQSIKAAKETNWQRDSSPIPPPGPIFLSFLLQSHQENWSWLIGSFDAYMAQAGTEGMETLVLLDKDGF